MRNLKLQIQMTIDGFIAGPNGEMDWTVSDWDDGLKNYVGKLTEPVDCIILGRKLAQGFIPYWTSNPSEEGAEKINCTKKIVFSRTLIRSEWDNTVLAKGDLEEEITELKKQSGKDIIVYGGAAFVSVLIRMGLIDEYHLFINPVAIGNGMMIFKDFDYKKGLKLIKATAFDCGIVVINYVPKRNET